MRLGQPPVLHGLGEVGLGGRDERVLQPVHGLAFLLRDVGEGGAVVEARLQRRLGDAQIACRGVEIGEVVTLAVKATTGADPDERHVTCGDPCLHLVALGLRDLPSRDSGVDAILKRFRQRGVELRRVDSELLGGVGDDRVALLRRRQPVGCDCGAAADQCRCSNCDAGDLALRGLHLAAPLGVG